MTFPNLRMPGGPALDTSGLPDQRLVRPDESRALTEQARQLPPGNANPHVHWHIFPRHENDPHRGNPWRDAARFNERLITLEQAGGIAARVRDNFE